ncbi:MAG: tetratricopeptide repeat protein, partial [Bacteroidia bacterium]
TSDNIIESQLALSLIARHFLIQPLAAFFHADLINIGIVFKQQGDYTKALDYYLRSLKTAEELGNNRIISACYGNIGVIYWAQKNYSKALEYQMKDLALDQKVGNKQGIAEDLDNIGIIYHDKGDYLKALDYDNRSLKIYHELEEGKGVAINLINMGEIYIEQKNYKNAKSALDTALHISTELGEIELAKSTYSNLSALDSAIGNYKEAFIDYKKYVYYRDSIINATNTKRSVQAEMNFNFEQKQAAEKAEQDKKDAVNEQERKKQVIIRNSFITGFLLMIALAFFIFRGYRQKQRTNIIITKQKEEVEKQKDIVEHQKELVEQQKELVEEKNKEILDSITYAKRLQDAILPPLSLITEYFPESFVLYKPKDIVAGDFYWMERAGDNILIAAADCTGHGVPGALVSVVCSNALNRTVKEFHITDPGKILDKVRELVLETFEKSASNVQDGMDISLCCINTKANKAQWSGAYNSLWYIHNGQMQEVEADKQPIGKNDKPLPFNSHNLKLQKGDTLYLFTDGYADQFGGPKGKKFKYKQLQEILLANSVAPMDDQKKKLEGILNDWKGSLEQVDDILIIGIRV